MNRIIAAGLVAVLTAVLGGCGGKEKDPSPKRLPPASEMFDKQSVPSKAKGAGPG
jgi:hypothetical protein